MKKCYDLPFCTKVLPGSAAISLGSRPHDHVNLSDCIKRIKKVLLSLSVSDAVWVAWLVLIISGVYVAPGVFTQRIPLNLPVYVYLIIALNVPSVLNKILVSVREFGVEDLTKGGRER